MLSTDYNYIYIHIPKTAGASISAVLRKLPVKKYSRLRELFLYPRGVRSWNAGQHDKAFTLQQKIKKKNFERFFSFAVVRNPWDLMVSSYHWWTQKAVHRQGYATDRDIIINLDGFSGFIYSKYGASMINEFPGDMIDWVVDQRGKKIVNFIAKFETLSQDWKEITRLIGIPYHPLPHKNKSKRKHYREYYTQETKDLIAWRFQREIEAFGYTY